MEEENKDRTNYSVFDENNIEDHKENLSSQIAQDDSSTDIIDEKTSLSFVKSEPMMEEEDDKLIDILSSHTYIGIEDEDTYIYTSPPCSSSSEEDLIPPVRVYSHSSTEILNTFDFSKIGKDENENPLIIPCTPPELTKEEINSVNMVNNMKRDPLYAATTVFRKGHQTIIDSFLALQDDSAPIECKETLLDTLFTELLPKRVEKDGSTGSITGSGTPHTFLHDPGEGWLTHHFIDTVTLELKRLRMEHTEQKWSDVNAPQMQTLKKCVQSVDEVLTNSNKKELHLTEIISNSGSEPSLNYVLEGGITDVPLSSLISKNENETTDIITTDNSKWANSYISTNEDEVNLSTTTKFPKTTKSSIVHCLAGVQELPDFLTAPVNASKHQNQFIYSSTDNTKMVSMSAQTDFSKSQLSEKHGLNILNEENEYTDTIPPLQDEFQIVLPPNRPTTPNSIKNSDSDDELNPSFYKHSEDSDDEIKFFNTVSNISDITDEKHEKSDDLEEEDKKQELQTALISISIPVPNNESSSFVGDNNSDKLNEVELNQEVPVKCFEDISLSLAVVNETAEEVENVGNSLNGVSNVDTKSEDIEYPLETLTTEILDESIVENTNGSNISLSIMNGENNESVLHYYPDTSTPLLGRRRIEKKKLSPKINKDTKNRDRFKGASMLDTIAGETESSSIESPIYLIKVVTPPKVLKNRPNTTTRPSTSVSTYGNIKNKSNIIPTRPSTSTVVGTSGQTKVQIPFLSTTATIKSKPKPILTDASTSASISESVEVETKNSGSVIPKVSGFTTTEEKSRMRKCFETKPKPRSKPIRPITQPARSYAQKQKDKREVEKEQGTTSTTNKKPTTSKPMWR